MKKQVLEFISNLENERRRSDSEALVDLIEEESGYEPYIHGSMIGYGRYHYKYESGREGDFFVTGFSPRKQHLAVYIMPGFSSYETMLENLGKHKVGKSCLYINKLADIDLTVLRKLVKASVKDMQKKYQCASA
ncbi:DUF1801 domain-containing protein [Gilvimarinus sp. SDUM040013]|uniref:DUF1801 domain-containing protein n=1 Tax=Gilvimarinus gilvus TaxID=3058038 RepID=A0ABU4RYR4_9GAMM|nr:DUF1801 domain-containing protein [Gilvimarinus sp. SDUM040013]MDO3386324.1 DUF1801 domain-containing protein [Gilvimarinus sp. SDUM040013]MDX6850018.1 DUF1801 domain-containing protein [Gilvimarinus sp. SDUM040013]